VTLSMNKTRQENKVEINVNKVEGCLTMDDGSGSQKEEWVNLTRPVQPPLTHGGISILT